MRNLVFCAAFQSVDELYKRARRILSHTCIFKRDERYFRLTGEGTDSQIDALESLEFDGVLGGEGEHEEEDEDDYGYSESPSEPSYESPPVASFGSHLGNSFGSLRSATLSTSTFAESESFDGSFDY